MDVWHISYLDLTLRFIVSAVLGGFIGFEREWRNHPAGLRTHILVCVGSTAIMLLSIYGFSEFVDEVNVRVDPARLAAQVISGIGFLGAGAIMRSGLTVSGLTTAASIWVVAAIGLCVGAGFFYVAVMATIAVLISLVVLHKWENYLMRHRRRHEISMKIVDEPGNLAQITAVFADQGVQIQNLRMHAVEGGEEGESPIMELHCTLKSAHPERLKRSLNSIFSMKGVISVETDHMDQLAKKMKKSSDRLSV
ncbi:MgtC/SapB family protein [Paenibacillus sp. IITD108]